MKKEYNISVGEVTTGIGFILRLLPQICGDTNRWSAGDVEVRHILMQLICPVILKLERRE